MSILTRDEILKEVRDGRIRIEPFDESQLGPASYDLRLDNKFRTFLKVHDIFDVDEDANYETITKYVEVKERFLLMPGEAVLGITEEKITLPPDICGWLEGRSRFARVGLTVHITAGFMQPGISNRQVLEINNMGAAPLALKPGTRVAQFIFQRTIGQAVYKGRFSAQDRP